MHRLGDELGVVPPYSTGGGGTVLEHRYGAVLLSSLLLGDPTPELGDEFVPESVRFQASASSPVDDLLVVGRTSSGAERRVSIGVRRAPTLVRSDRRSVELLTSYVRVVMDHPDEVSSGQWRLALAVASPSPPAAQLRELATIAQAAGDATGFYAEVQLPGRTNRPTRERLSHLRDLVADGAQQAGWAVNEVEVGELTWRVLFALRLRELRLEGIDEADRTHAVSRLRALVLDGSLDGASRIYSRLAELASGYAPAGALVTAATLRRDVSIPLGRSPSYHHAWQIIDGLADRLRQRINIQLANSEGTLELERLDIRERLLGDLKRAASAPGSLVIRGEPDVGKSALTLRATEQLIAAGGSVIALSLRDLPLTTLELEGRFGGRLVDVLSGSAVAPTRLLVVDGGEAVLGSSAPLLQEIAGAALRSGLGVAVVTRTDGARAVADALTAAGSASGVAGSVEEFEVPPLSQTETAQVASTFASLARLQSPVPTRPFDRQSRATVPQGTARFLGDPFTTATSISSHGLGRSSGRAATRGDLASALILSDSTVSKPRIATLGRGRPRRTPAPDCIYRMISNPTPTPLPALTESAEAPRGPCQDFTIRFSMTAGAADASDEEMRRLSRVSGTPLERLSGASS